VSCLEPILHWLYESLVCWGWFHGFSHEWCANDLPLHWQSRFCYSESWGTYLLFSSAMNVDGRPGKTISYTHATVSFKLSIHSYTPHFGKAMLP
jgi:hypothetical protein